MKWIKFLNDYAGLIALLALIATIAVPIVMYKIEACNKRKELEDELKAMQDSHIPGSTREDQKEFARRFFLEKQLKKR